MKNVVYIYDIDVQEKTLKEWLEECHKKLVFLYGEEINLVPAGLDFSHKKDRFLTSLSFVSIQCLQADMVVIGSLTETWSDFFKGITNAFKFLCAAKNKEDLSNLFNKKRDLEALGMLKVKDEPCEG